MFFQIFPFHLQPASSVVVVRKCWLLPQVKQAIKNGNSESFFQNYVSEKSGLIDRKRKMTKKTLQLLKSNQLSRDFVAEAFLPLVGEFTAIRLVCSYHLVFSWKVSFFFDFTFTQLRCSWENNAPSCWSETVKCGNSSASVENCKKPCLNFYYNCSSLGTSNFLD